MKKSGFFLLLGLIAVFTFTFISCEEEETKSAPVVTTADVTDITQTAAKCGGNVTDDGNADITAKGVVWSNATDPTIENNSGMTTDGTGDGEFTSNITSLGPNITYYVKAYATNSEGTSYGEEKEFKTPI
jgi:uncharacterized protein (DUF2147 family)